MNKSIKALSAIAAAAAIVGSTVASTSVMAWGDNGGGRKGITKAEANNLSADQIIFNSITDGSDGDERNFVSARETGATGLWSANEITVSEGKTYDVSLYIHNNERLFFRREKRYCYFRP